MPSKERLTVPFEIKGVDAKARTFRGLAAAWSKDLGNDVIHKGAFARTIDHWRGAKKSRPIPLLDSHDRFSVASVLGMMTDAEEKDSGLDTGWEFIPNDSASEAAARRVAGGFITGMSIGYEPVKYEYEPTKSGERIRHLTEVKLREVSLVVFPMNEDARADASSVKSLLDAFRNGTLTEEQKQAIRDLPTEQKNEFRALLDAPPAGTLADVPKGLAPDDPRRIGFNSALRTVRLRRLATRISDSARA